MKIKSRYFSSTLILVKTFGIVNFFQLPWKFTAKRFYCIFIRFESYTNVTEYALCRIIVFNSSAFSSRKLNLKIQKQTVVPCNFCIVWKSAKVTTHAWKYASKFHTWCHILSHCANLWISLQGPHRNTVDGSSMAKTWFTHSRHESRKIDGLAGSIYEIAISPIRPQLLNFLCLAFPSQIFLTGTCCKWCPF
jgi:hypothetical protein